MGPGSRVVLMPDKGGVADALTKQLQSIGVEVLRIEGEPDADALINSIKNWTASGPVKGVYWLAALDHEKSLLKMDLPSWREALRVRVKLLYTTMRALYEQIATPGTFLVSASLLGGQHGYDEAGAIAPLGRSVIGMTKTYKRERADVTVKASISNWDTRRRKLPTSLSKRPCAIRAQSRLGTKKVSAGPSDCRNNLQPMASPV